MLGLGLAVGVLNGLLIIVLRVQPIVVTLAMFFSLQGVDLLIAPNPVSLSEQRLGPAPRRLGRADPRRAVHDRRCRC